MARFKIFTLDGVTFRLTPMSWDEAETHIEESKEILAREPEPKAEEWAKRTLTTVLKALNLGRPEGTAEWTMTDLTREYDMVLIRVIYETYMEMSGLRVGPEGEVRATAKI